jgi:hypothetical protein
VRVVRFHEYADVWAGLGMTETGFVGFLDTNY